LSISEFEVLCDDTDMVVYFNKTALDERTITDYSNRTYKIAFAGQADVSTCSVDGSTISNIDSNYGALVSTAAFSSRIYISSGYGDCGVNVFEDLDTITYNHSVIVTYGENPTPNVRREEYDTYNVQCIRNRTRILQDQFNTTFRKSGTDSSSTYS